MDTIKIIENVFFFTVKSLLQNPIFCKQLIKKKNFPIFLEILSIVC